MKTVFVSQPMKGLSNEAIKQARERVVDELEAEGYVVLDSILTDTPPKNDYEGVYYLGHSLVLLSEADYAYFMEGWENARGCKIEHTVALEYGIPILHDAVIK